MRRLLLVRHAPTTATRKAAFPLDEPLDERGRAQVATLPRHDQVVCSPALRCVETAQAAGLTATVEAAICGCDFGAWAGRTLAAVYGVDPEGAAAWMTDPGSAPHGGESLRALYERVAQWLAEQAREDGTLLVITHAEVIRVALVAALGAPLDAFWKFDVAPLSLTEMHARDGRWSVTRVNAS